MANPGNPDPNDPRLTDPLDPTMPRDTADPMIDNKGPPRGSGSTWLIALVVVVLAIIAYYVFARSGPPAPAEPPAATEQAPAPADGGTMAPANPPADSGMTEPATPAPAQ